VSNPTSWQAVEELVVTEPAAIEILWYPKKRIHLTPFLGHSTDLAGATSRLGIKKSAMSYWIDRLLAAGLIRVERVEKRTRHQVPYYRCVADRLRVALVDAPLESYEGVFDEFSQRWQGFAKSALARSLARQSKEVELIIAAGGASGISTTILPRAGAQPRDDFIYYWARLWLSTEEQQSLERDLNALWDKYALLSDKEHKPQTVLIHLIKVPENC